MSRRWLRQDLSHRPCQRGSVQPGRLRVDVRGGNVKSQIGFGPHRAGPSHLRHWRPLPSHRPLLRHRREVSKAEFEYLMPKEFEIALADRAQLQTCGYSLYRVHLDFLFIGWRLDLTYLVTICWRISITTPSRRSRRPVYCREPQPVFLFVDLNTFNLYTPVPSQLLTVLLTHLLTTSFQL